jgi:hypothetical protein
MISRSKGHTDPGLKKRILDLKNGSRIKKTDPGFFKKTDPGLKNRILD